MARGTAQRLLFALVAVFVCAGQVCVAARADVRDDYPDLRALSAAYKSLFVRSSDLGDAEALEKLQMVANARGRPDIKEPPMDVDFLIQINNTMEEHCSDPAYMGRLLQTVNACKRNYRGVYPYVKHVYKRQVALCDYAGRLKRIVEEFKSSNSRQWKLIKEYNKSLKKHGGGWSHGSANEALSQMFKGHSIKPENQYQGSYKLTTDLMESCGTLLGRVGETLLRNVEGLKMRRGDEMLNWLRYLRVCQEVTQANFEPAMYQQHWPEFDRAYNHHKALGG